MSITASRHPHFSNHPKAHLPQRATQVLGEFGVGLHSARGKAADALSSGSTGVPCRVDTISRSIDGEPVKSPASLPRGPGTAQHRLGPRRLWRRPPPALAAPPGRWVCPDCEEPNKAERRECNNCRRQRLSAAPAPTAASRESAAPPQEAWASEAHLESGLASEGPDLAPPRADTADEGAAGPPASDASGGGSDSSDSEVCFVGVTPLLCGVGGELAKHKVSVHAGRLAGACRG